MRNPEFFLHGNSNSKDVERIAHEGFVARGKESGVEEGRATFSTNLIKALEFAANDKDVSKGTGHDGGGGIVLFKRSEDARYVIAPTPRGFIHKREGDVHGNAKHYSEGRNHLGVFTNEEAFERSATLYAAQKDAIARGEIQSGQSVEKVPNGTTLIDSQDVVCVLPVSPELRSFIAELKESIASVARIDVEHEVRSLASIIAKEGVQLDDEVIRTLVVETCKSQVMHLVRSSLLAREESDGARIQKHASITNPTFEHKSFAKHLPYTDVLKDKYADPSFSMGIDEVDRYVRRYVLRPSF